MEGIPELINRATRIGYSVILKNGQTSLRRTRGEKQMPPDLIEAFKSNREAIVQWLSGANNPANATDTTAFPGTPTHSQEVNDRFTAPQANPVTVALEICRECKAKVDAKEMRKAPNVLCAWEHVTH